MIILRFFPNGEFTKGVSATKRRDERANRKDSITAHMIPVGSFRSLRWRDQDVCVRENLVPVQPGDEFTDGNETVYTYLCNDFGTQTYAFECRDGRVGTLALEDTLHRHITIGELSPLGLSDARILKEPCVSRKKCLKMTSSMSRNIRNAAYLLTRKYGKDQLSFLTLTLPALSQEALGRVCANWDKMVHRFFAWLRQTLDSKHIEPCFVYCTEIQTKRLELRHEYAPHLHIIFRGRSGKKCNWAITPSMAKKAWVRCIKSYTDESFDTRAVENLQRVKKDAGRYLSKYMSKGSNCLPEGDEGASGIALLRTHWGGMSRNLSKSIREGIVRLTDARGQQHITTCFLSSIPFLIDSGLIKYYKENIISFSGSPSDEGTRGIKVGVGCLDKSPLDGGLSACLSVATQLYEFGLC